MLKGLFDAAAGMKARLAVQDIIASNLANAGTNGFQRQVVAIHARSLPPASVAARIHPLRAAAAQFQAQRAADTDPGLPVPTPREVLEPYSAADSRVGVMQQTGASTDLALEGAGYLVVQTGAGT